MYATVKEFEAAMAANAVEVKITQNVTFARLIDTFICAFEGGSNSWCSFWCAEWTGREESEEAKAARNEKIEAIRAAFPHELGSMYHDADNTGFARYIIGNSYFAPFVGDAWVIEHEHPTANGKKETRVGLPGIIEGLALMAIGHPKEFAEIVNNNEDANTGDILLQYCCFREVVFC